MKASQSMKTNGIFVTALFCMVVLLSACERAAPPIETRPGATVPPAGTAAATVSATNIPGIPTVLPTIAQAGTVSPVSPTIAAGTAAPAATSTRVVPGTTATIRPQVATATAVPPTKAPVSQATPAQFPPPPTSGKTMTLKIFLIAVNDNGASGPKIGCGDSVVAVDRVLPNSSSPLTDVTKYLVALRGQYYGQPPLYNVFYQSKLTVDSVILNGTKASFHLRGTMSLGGECDDPRFEAQLKYTALQFPTVKSVEIFVNNKLLSSVLGGN